MLDVCPECESQRYCPICGACRNCGLRLPAKIDPKRTKSVDPQSTKGKILLFIYECNNGGWVSKRMLIKLLGRAHDVWVDGGKPSKPTLHMAIKKLKEMGFLQEENKFLKIPDGMQIIRE